MRPFRALAFAALLAAPSACSAAPTTADGHPILASNLGDVRQLVASGGYVYLAEPDSAGAQTSTIARVPDGGGTAQPLVSGVAEVTALAVDGETVYWTDENGALNAVPASGVAPGESPRVIATKLASPTAVAVAGGAPYVLETSDKLATSIVGFGAGGTDPVAMASASSGAILALVGDGSAIYFADDRFDCPAPSCSTVYRYVPGAGAPTALFTTPMLVTELATDGSRLYAGGQDPSNTQQIVVVPTAGGDVQTLAPGLAHLDAMAASSDGVYYADWTAGVWKQPLSGGAPVQVTTEPSPRMASDDSGVYALDVQEPLGVVLIAASR